jgi:hypothetical protein
MTADDQLLFQAPETEPTPLLRAISIFIPRPVFNIRSQSNVHDAKIAIEKFTQPSQSLDDITLTRLVKNLAQDPHPHVVLFTGNEIASAKVTFLGAYFPGPLWVEANEGKKHELKAGTSHILFQFGPRLRLLRYTNSHVPLTDIISTDETVSLEAIAASDAESPNFSKPYRIGSPGREGHGLYIDPETRSVTLSKPPASGSGGKLWYRDICMNGASSDATLNNTWEVTIKPFELKIFRVSGDLEDDFATRMIKRAEDQLRQMQEEMQPKITGEELMKRIQGFGSTA